VLDLTDQRLTELKRIIGSASIQVSGIASPIGKSPVDSSMEAEVAGIQRALEVCDALDCRSIRVFSYYSPDHADESVATWGDRALQRLRVLVDEVEGTGVTLLHENDTGLYGETVDRCGEIFSHFRVDELGAVLDPANFLLAGQEPFPAAYEAVRSRLRCVHVKDASRGTVVPAGEGDARFPEMLRTMRADEYDGIFALEPHLRSAGRLAGFSGPQLFAQAVEAFKRLLADAGCEWT
jgi:sugar phosphate isomerase/epimerase